MERKYINLVLCKIRNYKDRYKLNFNSSVRVKNHAKSGLCRDKLTRMYVTQLKIYIARLAYES